MYRLLAPLRKLLPRPLRRLGRRVFNFTEYERWRRLEGLRELLATETFTGVSTRPRLGIFREFFSYHKDYVHACRELGVSYSLLDLQADDWLERIKRSECDAFLVWPSSIPARWKQMFDDRVRFLVEDLRLLVYPSLKELWLYESKLRAREWLAVHEFPHPKTWVFFDRSEALEFSLRCPLPIVFKTESGGSASGVYVLRRRRGVENIIRLAFGPGVPLKSLPRERQQGVVYFQEYLPFAKEWRMVRVGDSFFGYRKEPGEGGLHSASHRWSWLDPPRSLLDLLLAVTEAGPFTSMDVDVFESQDGRYLVNELQTVFGATTPVDQLRVNDRPGRYVRSAAGEWLFEEGDYSRNAVCNLRIQYVLQLLGAWNPNDPLTARGEGL